MILASYGRLSAWLARAPPLVDLVATVVVAVVSALALAAAWLDGSPLEVPVALLLMFVLPGYAVVAALFPASEDAVSGRTPSGVPTDGVGLGPLARVPLAIVASVVAAVLVGLGLSLTHLGLGRVPLAAALAGVTVVCATIAAYRRLALPTVARFRPFRESAFGRPFAGNRSALGVGWSLLLVTGILVAAATAAYGVSVPIRGETYTELSLLTTNESGDLVADEYPDALRRGEARELVVGVGNHEGERVEYDVVVALQRFGEGDEETRITEAERLARFRTAVDPNGTAHTPVTIRPTLTGESLRLTALLYRGDAPADPSVATAYREVHVWVDVREA